MKGSRIIIPQTLKKGILEKLHNGHQGIEKCKRRARQSCYWPNMNYEIESMCEKCKHCMKYSSGKQTLELKAPEFPD